jgi:hypothetical protein
MRPNFDKFDFEAIHEAVAECCHGPFGPGESLRVQRRHDSRTVAFICHGAPLRENTTVTSMFYHRRVGDQQLSVYSLSA